jgi:hypothetical protein
MSAKLASIIDTSRAVRAVTDIFNSCHYQKGQAPVAADPLDMNHIWSYHSMDQVESKTLPSCGSVKLKGSHSLMPTPLGEASFSSTQV